MPLVFARYPYQDPIGIPSPEDERKGKGTAVYLPQSWIDWFTALTQRVETAPNRVAAVTLEEQSAAIGSTDIPIGNVLAGVYRLSYYARISTAAGSSSSLTVSLGWPDGAVAQSFSGSAITGNTTTTYQTATLEVLVDAAGPITYSTAYSSTGSPAMEYTLVVTAEVVSAS